MTTPDDLPEMDAELAALLADAKHIEGPPADVRARLRKRLVSALPPLPPDGGSPASPESPPISSPWTVPAWAVAAAFVVGVGTGALATRGDALRDTRRGAAPEARPPASPPASVPTAVDVLPAPPAPPEAAPTSAVAVSALPSVPRLTPSAPPTRPDVGSTDLTRERGLLDVARTALGRNDGPSALAACAEHERAFPRGALREEREAIAIQALVLSGRADEARARAARFEKAFPTSILLPAVRGAAGVSP